VFIMHTDSETI